MDKYEFIEMNYGKMSFKEMSELLGFSQSHLYKIANELELIGKDTVIDLDDEIWKIHPNYPNYKVSNKGRIKGIRNKIISTRVHEGYLDCRIIDKDDNKKSPRIHKLVADLFIDKPFSDEELVVNHKDGNKLNNNADNLEWITYRSNILHAVENDLISKPSYRLSEKEVIEICELLSSGYSYSEIHNYNPKYVKYRVERIRQRRSWEHITKNYKWA